MEQTFWKRPGCCQKCKKCSTLRSIAICNMFFPKQFVGSIWNNHFEKDLDFSNECCNISRNIIISDEKCLSKGMLQQFKGYCALWWIFFQKNVSERNAISNWTRHLEKGIHFSNGIQWIWEEISTKKFVSLKYVFQNMLCTPLGYSTYAVCFFFSNLDNVLFLSMFYVVMHRCVEMHVDVYDIDAFRCTTIYIHIYIYTDDCRCIS